MGVSLERFVERNSPTADRRSDRLVPVLNCRTLLDGIVGQVISAVAFWRSSVFSGDGTMPMPGTSILSAKRRRPKCHRKMRWFDCCCVDAR